MQEDATPLQADHIEHCKGCARPVFAIFDGKLVTTSEHGGRHHRNAYTLAEITDMFHAGASAKVLNTHPTR